MARAVLTAILLWICLIQYVQAGKILMSAGVDTTHYLFSSKIGRELVRRGNDVTFLLSSSYSHRLNSSDTEWFKFQVYDSPYTYGEIRNMTHRFGLEALNGTYQKTTDYSKILMRLICGGKSEQTEEERQEQLKPTKPMSKYLAHECNALLGDDETMERLRGLNFDLMTFDIINPCMALVAQKLSLRYAIITAAPLVNGFHDRWFDVPSNPAYIPLVMSPSGDSMAFMERFRNTVTWFVMSAVVDHFTFRPYEELRIKYNIRPDLTMPDIIRAAEIWISNTHFAMEYARPIMPNMIMVGGLSADESKPLDRDLDEFFEGSGDAGVVIFSLGSVVEVMSESQTNIVARAMARLPQRVLWRIHGQPPKSLGSNTKVVKWLPQNDVLGHPKTKLLIYHGGINGMIETMYHGVPVVAIPLFGEHSDCATRLKRRGMTEIISMADFTEDMIYETAVRILSNDSYAANAKLMSAIMKHNAAPQLQVAAHWVEHVMLHGGDYFRSKAGQLTTVQYYLVDVIAVAASIIIVVVLTLGCACRLLCRRCTNSAQVKMKAF
ncbi:UDP-glucuronosyltransferase 2C1-like isoform X2 [Asterias amurensis]|uniref:UDP-glucuronosyltransferase 2C1-like isoform X2 n=1 Tax=Asterias amurensis TaxID=7602 RepID=UPI003AB652F6